MIIFFSSLRLFGCTIQYKQPVILKKNSEATSMNFSTDLCLFPGSYRYYRLSVL